MYRHLDTHGSVWRVEKFTVKKWPATRIGEFHTGDSYIVLHTYKKDDKFLYDVSC